MKEIKAVIFDLDGTLLDTLEDLADSMNHVLAEYGFPERSLSEIRQFVGNGVRRLVERAVCYPNDPKPEQKDLLDRMFASMKAYYESHCNGKTAPYPGIKKTLEQLKQDGLKLGIVSNKLDAAVKELNAVYFADWIPVAVGDRPGCRVKPAADLLQAAVAELGVEPSECLYVGDSEVDVQTAANAGIPCITALWGFRDRDMLEKEGAVVFADTAERLLAKIRERVHFGRSDYRYLLFDLDGTLTNPEEGITKCVQYSLASFGIQAECRDLLKFIGNAS